MATSYKNIKGGQELMAFLQALPGNIGKNALRAGMRQGANVIRDDARSRIHNVSGDLSRSVKVKTDARGGQVTATVTAGDKKAFYGPLVEFGTAPHVIDPATGALAFNGKVVSEVHHPGARPHPFMRPAADGNTAEIVRVVGGAVTAYLEKRGIGGAPSLSVDDDE